MPDHRCHRGPQTNDRRLFDRQALHRLRTAAGDFCWLLNRGFAEKSSLKLVGDRYELTARQRMALRRCVCDDAELLRRGQHEIDAAQLRGATLFIDGFNVLVTIETALGQGAVLAARDGCYRDMASMHGTYRKVAETADALALVGRCCTELNVVACRWFFDRPVSNSGRLKSLAENLASNNGWPWNVQLVADVDRALIDSDATVATADSVILDRCEKWFNLARLVIERYVGGAWIVDFTSQSP